MKTRLYTFLLCLLLGIASSVQAQEPGKVSVKLNSANLRGQTLHLDLNINIDNLHVSSRSTLALTLALKNGNSLVLLPHVFVHGSNKFNMFERAVTLKGLETAMDGAYEVLRSDHRQRLTVAFKMPVAYKPWMNKCQLILIRESLDYYNNPVETFTDVLQNSLVIKGATTTTPSNSRSKRR